MPHDVVRGKDPDGTAIVGVKLSNRDCRAWTDEVSYSFVCAIIGTPSWRATTTPEGRTYVAVSPGGRARVAILARLIIQAPRGVVVTYRDRDGFNLRRSNLDTLGRLTAGPAKTIPVIDAGLSCSTANLTAANDPVFIQGGLFFEDAGTKMQVLLSRHGDLPTDDEEFVRMVYVDRYLGCATSPSGFAWALSAHDLARLLVISSRLGVDLLRPLHTSPASP